MIKAATGRVTGPSGQWPLGSARTRAAGARAALAFAPCICSSPSIRRMPRPFGGALAATRPQQQARLVTGAAAAAAARPQGDDGILGLRCGGAAQGSTGRSKTAASASAITDTDANASAVAAAHLLRGALEAALLPRLDAIKGDMCAMEERIVQRVEVGQVGQQQRRGLAGRGTGTAVGVRVRAGRQAGERAIGCAVGLSSPRAWVREAGKAPLYSPQREYGGCAPCGMQFHCSNFGSLLYAVTHTCSPTTEWHLLASPLAC